MPKGRERVRLGVQHHPQVVCEFFMCEHIVLSRGTCSNVCNNVVHIIPTFPLCNAEKNIV